MRNPLPLGGMGATVVVAVAAIVCAGLLLTSGCGRPGNRNPPQGPGSATNSSGFDAAVELAANQLNAVKVEAVETYRFPVEKEAVGSIDFDEDLSVQVFPPYQGKILKTFVELGDDVQKGQPLYTIESPDLIQAESALIGAAADARSDRQRTGARKGTLWDERGFPKRD